MVAGSIEEERTKRSASGRIDQLVDSDEAAAVTPGHQLRRFAVLTPGRVLLVVVLAGSSWLWLLGRGQAPLAEEIGFAYLNRSIGTGLWTMWKGGWFFPLLRLTYNILYAAVGFHTFAPFRLFALACNGFLVWSVYLYCRSHHTPWFGTLMGTYLILFGPAAGHTALWPLLANFPLAIASLPVSLVLLEREDSRGDISAAAVMLVALGFNGPATLPVCCGVGIWILLKRPLRPARLITPALPVAVYALAFLFAPSAPSVQPPHYPTGFAFPPDSLNVVRFFGRASAAVPATLFGLGPRLLAPAQSLRLGFLLLVAIVVLVGAYWSRLSGSARRRVGACSTSALVFWVTTAIARSGSYGIEAATTQRYIILGAVPALLVFSEIYTVMAERPRNVMVALVLIAACLNGLISVDLARDMRGRSELQRARAAALELVGPRAPDGYYPAVGIDELLFWVNHRQYRDLTSRYGSFAMPYGRIPRASAVARWEVDRILRELNGVEVRNRRMPLTSVGCATWKDGPHHIPIPASGLLVMNRGKAETLRYRRFGDDYYGEPGVSRLAAGQAVEVRPRIDQSPVGWQIEIRGPAEVCSA